ncbi:Hypothetical protein CAP_2656 [Chondromyces apiculatus DSM 436]|uniref:DUF1795 domain-containing protein n=2 Tax=Chondromyces apiculatus TaxID=51 RepID=A0A017TIX0_9BACT|nr:Hypothetical protein CAP_2656 [Chondromyces apiculatus DSM 436]
MSIYYMNEAAFDLPEGFVDRTVNYLEGRSPQGTPVALLVQREPFPEGKTLRQATTAHVNDAKKRLRAYTVLFEREVQVSEVPAIDLGVRWRDEKGMVYTRQVHLVLDRTHTIVAGETPFEEREYCDTYVDHVLASLRLRD